MADHDSLIANFVAATETNTATAESYLEANDWDLALAVNSYFSSEQDIQATASVPSTTSPITSPTTNPATSANNSRPPVSSSKRGRVTTLQDILRQNESNENDEEEGEKYYAGGEKSGTMMQGAPKSNNEDSSSSLINRILKKAAEHQPPPPSSSLSSSSESAQLAENKPKSTSFTGRGYRLGDDVPVTMPSTEGAVSSSSSSTHHLENKGKQAEDASETAVRHLTFWSNGFTIDDGPLESYDNPANKAFLEAINNGHAPLDRLNVKRGQAVELAVERRLSEQYTPPPPPPAKPFSGAAHRLGSPTPALAATTTTTSTTTSTASANTAISTPSTGQILDVDPEQPMTTLQIRLADGTRLVAKFNHTHTVGDIRRYINA
ncbi:hypothetical protein BDF22DRAFT_674766 [Syncephalis plumigaleata]|nr:hypothetical protein BDF22DRAFT_674766 [Syncephalis plumigaleata]